MRVISLGNLENEDELKGGMKRLNHKSRSQLDLIQCQTDPEGC